MDQGVFHNYAVAVLIITPEGIPLVRDPKKPAPVFWKAPGGRSALGEDPEAAAIREVQEELGIRLSRSDLRTVHEEDRGSHVLVLFVAKLKLLPKKMKTRGDEDEEIKAFSASEILLMNDFFPNHRRAFEKTLSRETLT